MPEPASPTLRSNLRDSVGNGRTNHPDDLRWVKEALRLMGRYKGGEGTPYIDRTLAQAMKATSVTAAYAATAF